MEAPFLTVVVTIFNYARYLSENLQSLVTQWSEKNPFNILIFDDGSTDESLTILEQYQAKYSFVKVKTHPMHQNKGLAETIKAAVESVNSEWIAFLESDDFSQPGAIETLFDVFKKDVGLVFYDIKPAGLNNDEPSWFYSYVPRIRSYMLSIGAQKRPAMLDFKILEENLIPTFSCVAVKTNLLKEAEYICPVPEWIDWYLWVQICQKTKVLFVDKKLVNWRIHPASLNKKKQIAVYLSKYKLFRKSIRNVLLNSEIKNKSYKIAYLYLPTFVPLFMRFLKMSNYKGFKYVLKQIKGRLSQ